MSALLSPQTRREFLGLLVLSAAAVAIPAYAVGDEKPPKFLLEWGNRGKAEGEFDIPIGLAIDRRDEILIAEFRNNRVQRFDRNGKFLFAFTTAYEQPGGIAVDGKGDIYVGHLVPSKITVYNKEGKLLREWGKPGTGDGEFVQPGGIAVAPDGSIYVADQVNRRVQKFNREGKFLLNWGEYGVGPGQFGGNEKPENRTGGPQFVAVDKKGNVYTTEGSVGRVQKFTPEGKYLLSWGDNSAEPGGFGGRPKNLPGPIAVCLDRRGNVWVSATNHWVQQFTPEGKFLRRIGGEGTGPGQFHTPHGIGFDSRGHFYVCDTQNARIQKFEV
jgi:sugar lactone lactonase YvrE